MSTQRLLIAGGVLALAACASVPTPPTDAFQAADIAIANADKEHASDFAPVEMRSAHEKITAARVMPKDPDDESMTRSRRLADEARADADLATAKARQAKAAAVNADMQKSNNTLRTETQRSSGN